MGGGHLHPSHVDPKFLECKRRPGSAYKAKGVPRDPLVEENALFKGEGVEEFRGEFRGVVRLQGEGRAQEPPGGGERALQGEGMEENALFKGERWRSFEGSL